MNELPTPWQQEQLAKLRQMFPDFEIWWIYKAVVRPDESRFSWHARPKGARRSVCDAETPDHLAAKIQRYLDNLETHIAAARSDLEQTPPELHHLHEAVGNELQALLVMHAGHSAAR